MMNILVTTRTKRICVWTLLLSFSLLLSAQVPADYYRSAEGLKGARLKAALHDLMQPKQVLRYGGKKEGYTWAGFYQTDRVDGDYVRDRYSHEQRRFVNSYSSVDNMHIEHIWANSWWGHVVNNAYCDLFNLYPADATANIHKNNNPIGLVNEEVAYENGVIKVGKSSSYRADSLITVWEPADNWKGDFARTYFYMATCYSHQRDLWTTSEGLLTVDPASELIMRPWVSQLMVQWAEEDPLDDVERQRNEAIYALQGNRNPFVDYPQLSDYIWGTKQTETFYFNAVTSQPILYVPQPDAVFDYGLQPLQKGHTATLNVRGRNLPSGVTLSLDNDAYQLSHTQLTAQEIEEGATLSIHVQAAQTGPSEALLTIRGEGYEQHNILRTTFIDGIPAYEASDIVCATNSKRFTAHWMDYEPDATYLLSVYTKDAQGEAIPLGTYTTKSHTYQVKAGLKPETTYYYTVSLQQADGTLTATSNEVRVDMPKVSPIFSVSPSAVALTSVPERASEAVQMSVTTLAVEEYVTTVTVSAPFELSETGAPADEWTHTLTLTGKSPVFYVRMAAVPQEGSYESEMVLSTPGVEERIVTVTGTVDATRSFFENFETGKKGSYAEAGVTCSAATWQMRDAMIAADANRNDAKSVRMKGGGAVVMTTDKPLGCDSVWFYAGLYNKDKGTTLTVSYSVDGGHNWTPLVTDLALDTWQRYGYKIAAQGDVRIKFESSSASSKRLNLDDVQLDDYKDATGLTLSPAESGEAAPLYDLSGRRVHPRQRGIHVQQGRKMLR